MLTVVLFQIVKRWKQAICPKTDDWIKNVVNPYNGILFRHKKAWMNL